MQMVAPLEIGLCCSDASRLTDFYVHVLGCTVVSKIDVPAAKARESALSEDSYRVIRLQTAYGERIKLLQPKVAPRFREEARWLLEWRNAAYLTFIVDDLDLMLERLRRSHVRLMTGAAKVEVRPGVWLAFARDPEGNVLEFVQYDDLAAYRSGPASPGTSSKPKPGC